jgi:mono/diheme cytochrome c family protein
MRIRIFGITAACVMMTFLAAAAGPQNTTPRTWVAPRAMDAERNPLANRPETWPGGMKVFRQRCAACHGDDGTGTKRGPNLMTGPVQKQTDGALFWKISSGNTRTGMPSFSFLPEAQRWQLVSDLRAASRE